MHNASMSWETAMQHETGEDRATGERFVFFWGHASPFSQWHAATFELGGIWCPTAEHWMMAAKAMLFGDRDALGDIVATAHPGTAKRIGRRVRGFDDAVWREVSPELVYAGNHAKFTQHDGLRAALEATSPATLVEASPTDRIWGIGLSSSHADACCRARWRGRNRLGAVLTQLRDELRDGTAADRAHRALARLAP